MSNNSVAWRLLDTAVEALWELERHLFAVEAALANAGVDVVPPPAGLVYKITNVMYDSRIALAVHKEQGAPSDC